MSELVNGSGQIVAHYEYDPYGNVIASSGTLANTNPIRFSTKWCDGELEAQGGPVLYYYGERYYIPRIGRWASWDPIEERGGLNLYGLVQNRPINRWDSRGLIVGLGGIIPGWPEGRIAKERKRCQEPL